MKFKINHCKCHGFIFHGFYLPIGAVYGTDCKGLFVYTLIRYQVKDLPDGLIIYRQKSDGTWDKHFECNTTTKSICRYMSEHALRYQDCKDIKTSQKSLASLQTRFPKSKPMILEHRGKRIPITKYYETKSGKTGIWA